MATGTRKRYNFSKGRLGVAVTTGDTTLDLGEDPGWETLSADEYIPLALSDSEIVHVVDYTTGTSVCTVERGREGTVAAAHVLGASWVAAPTTLDFDHAELDGIGGDQHPDLLNNARHDVTERHPITVLGDGSGLGLRAKDYVTSTTTLEKADFPWLRLVVVRLVGAGGGGAAAGANAGDAGAGGGGGEYAEIVLVPANLLDSEDLTIGQAGAGGTAGPNNGANGGSTRFGSHAAAGGGGGGQHNGAPGAGGTEGYGGLVLEGTPGSAPWTPGDWTVGGKGGGSPFGSGGREALLQDGTSLAGFDASGYGAGGGGACNDGGGSAAGGAGTGGLIIVEFYG